VTRAGLLHRATSGSIAGPPELFLGFWPDRGRKLPLYDDGPHHVFVFAPTRSGKGAGLVVPNLLLWKGSVVVCDIKGENYAFICDLPTPSAPVAMARSSFATSTIHCHAMAISWAAWQERPLSES